MSFSLIDTSVLSRLIERDSERGTAAERAVRDPPPDWGELAVCAQVLTEFWVVATRPVNVNGYGLTPAEVDAHIADFLELFTLLPDPPDLFERWRALVVAHKVCGKPAHDARLAALMGAYAVGRILTFNPRDFRRFPGIDIVTP